MKRQYFLIKAINSNSDVTLYSTYSVSLPSEKLQVAFPYCGLHSE